MILALSCVGCRRDPSGATSRATAIRRSSVTVEVSGPPGCVVDHNSDSFPIGDDGIVRFEDDVSSIFQTAQGTGETAIHLRVVCKSFFGTEHAEVDIELPLDTAAINRIPEDGIAVVRSSAELREAAAARSSDDPLVRIGVDQDGLALLPVAAPGSSAIEVAGTPVTLDPIAAFATAHVDLAPFVLAGEAFGEAELSVPVTLVRDGGNTTAALALVMDEEQQRAALDRWIEGGSPASALPPEPAAAILWRRATEPSGPRYAHVGTTSTVGARYLATEETSSEPFRDCAYIQLIGVTREVVLRDVVTGEEVARRTFPPSRRARCPALVYSTQPDQLYFASNESVQEWLERELAHVAH